MSNISGNTNINEINNPTSIGVAAPIHEIRKPGYSSPLLMLVLMGIGFLLPLLGTAGQFLGLVAEIGLVILLAGFVFSGKQNSGRFFVYLGLLVGGEIFFRNFVHRSIPGYMIVEYATLGIGFFSITRITSLRSKKSLSLVLWVVFCAYAAFTLLYSPNVLDGRVFLLIFLSGLVIMSLVFSFGKKYILRLLEGTALGVSLVFGVLLYYAIFIPRPGRFGHGFNSAVQNSIFLTIGIICLILITKKAQLKWYRYAVPIIIFALGALLTFSRGPLIGALIAVLSIILSGNHLSVKLRNLITVFLLIGILGVIVYNAAPTQFINRYIGISVDYERIGIWEGSMAAWNEAPILGWGMGSWSIVYPMFSWVNPQAPITVSDAHNIFLQILVETGLIGEILFLFFLLSFLFKFVRLRSLECLGLLGYLLSVGFVDNWKILIFFILFSYLLVFNKDIN